jgi:hypothetical protein
MEGFTSSLHIKGASAKRVQDAVQDLLATEGFQVSLADEAPQAANDQTITRGIWVAKAKGDWVTVFCSDFLFQQEIGRELSKQLATHALHVWVNESSSWHYSLFQNGEEVDQFDSAGSMEASGFMDDDFDGALSDDFDDELDSDDDEFAAEGSGDEEDGPLQEGLSRMAELQEQISGKMPPEVREIYEKLQEGRASLGEMRRFDQWSQANQAELNRFQDEMQQQTAELTAAMQGLFQNNLPGDEATGDNPLGGMGDMLKGMLPPELGDLFGKVLSGEATEEDFKQIANLQGEDGNEMSLLGTDSDDDDVEEAFFDDDEEGDLEDGGFEDGGEFAEDDSEREAEQEQAIQSHLGALQPLLGKSVDPTEVAELLATEDESPEQPLGEFLSFLGIDSGFSELDFDCLEQLSSEELAEQGIKLNPLLLVRSE